MKDGPYEYDVCLSFASEQRRFVQRIADGLHQRVRGSIPRRVGPYPAGTPYSAFDPELMLWVVAPMYEATF